MTTYAAETATPPDPRRWLSLAILLIANFMNLIDVTIVNVALPSMREGLGATDSQIEWVVAAYVLAFALGLLPFGRLGDIVEYQQDAFFSLARNAALYRERYLQNFYTVGQRAVSRALGAPYAWVIPASQTDSGVTARLVNILRTADVEVQRATAPFDAGGAHYETGSYIVPLGQPFGAFAKTVLEVQHYPNIAQYPAAPIFLTPYFSFNSLIVASMMGSTWSGPCPFPPRPEDIHFMISKPAGRFSGMGSPSKRSGITTK